MDICMKNDKTQKPANPIWGGRFDLQTSDNMETLNASIDFDARLYTQDILGSKAHAKMLGACGIISEAEASMICQGLDKIQQEIAENCFNFQKKFEDIHMNIEVRLSELIGDTAGCLHTARSRNDQVATDFRLWVREAIDRLNVGIRNLQAVLIEQADEHSSSIMPGFTHLQIAQPITLGHHLLAYIEMFGRDRSRLVDARSRLNECPLGAAALAGTSFPIDRPMVAKTLGFDKPMTNSLDAVSDRDFAIEYLALASILIMHLSRLAEEIVIWSTEQFDYIQLSDRFTSGSSIMPQKKNPDAAELIRGKAGRVFGALHALLVSMKGLPLAYGKDMQEDKEPVFDATDTLEISLSVMADMLKGAVFNKRQMVNDAGKGFSIATDFADWLVKELNMPFRYAHETIGKIVKLAEKKSCNLGDLSLVELQSIHPKITVEIFSRLNIENSVNTRTSYGGTAPSEVVAQIDEARKRYLKD